MNSLSQLFAEDVMAQLLHELITDSARQTPTGLALRCGDNNMSYTELAQAMQAAAQGLLRLGLARGERVAVFLEKREEAVLAMFGAAAAGAVFVPVNPLLKPEQVAHILRDSGAALLITTPARLASLDLVLEHCPALRAVVQTGAGEASLPALPLTSWSTCMRGSSGGMQAHRCVETDLAALLYTSCGSGKPKGVMLSHRNLVAGALSLAECVGNTAQDRLLALLPLSSDHGLGQLTSAFASGAAVVLMNHLLIRDIPEMAARERITGLAATPPLWIQLAELDWGARPALRYLSSSGGAMPPATVDRLRRILPKVRLHLLYGQTEALRAACLAHEQLRLRPASIGKAMPNAELLLLTPEGRRCAPGETGELVHRGPMVARGYWNDAALSASRFRALPPALGLAPGETGVWSGDLARIDDEGYLYVLGRADALIKTGGYRVSPGEIEEIVYATGLVAEAAAFGIAHPVQGQAVALVAVAHDGCALAPSVLLAACRAKLPAYMMPAKVVLQEEALPRLADGGVDRGLLAKRMAQPLMVA